MAYDTCDDEHNRDSSVLESIAASYTNSKRDDDYNDDNNINDKEEGNEAAKLSSQTIYQIFANLSLGVRDYDLANSGDLHEDEDYSN